MTPVNQFVKGLNTDILAKYQEEGTYRWALNAILETEFGGMPAISNEHSNQICSIDVPTTKTLIGSALTDTDVAVLFYYDPAGDHEIGLHDPVTCTYTRLIHGPCLNFSDKYPINAIVKIRNGCDRVVYFTDNFNKYRVLNVDNIDNVLHPQTGELQCEKLLYTKEYFHPCIFLYRGVENTGIDESAGGNLEVGVYYFAVRFLDAEQNTTEWTMVTRGIAVADEPIRNVFSEGLVNLYDGGSNVETSPHYVPKTDKAISLVVTGQDFQFPYMQLAVIKRTSDSGGITGVEILKPVPFKGFFGGGAMLVPYVYTGNISQVDREGSIDEILIGRQPIDYVGAQTIKDDRIFVGNISTDNKDYQIYQRYASKIKTEWVKIPALTTIDAGVRRGNYYLLDGSFMENEVYALGIVYVFGNGRLSPVSHIVGRAADTTVTGNAHNPLIGSGGVPTSGGAAWDTGIQVYGGSVPGTTPNRWKQISTAFSYGSTTLEGLPGFYECDTETYPVIETCDDHPDGYWGRDWAGNLIVPGVTKIRHHKTPGAEIKGTALNAENFRTGFKFSNVEYPPNQDIVGHFFVYGDRNYDKTVQAKGVFIPLINDKLNTGTFKPETYTVPIIPGLGLADYNYVFVCAEELLTEKFIQADYVHIEKVLRDVNFETGGMGVVEYTTSSTMLIDEPTNTTATSTNNTFIRHFTRYDLPQTNEINATILSAIKVPKAYVGAMVGTESFDNYTQKTFTNESVNHDFHFLHLDRTISQSIVNNSGDWRGKAYFGSIRQTRKVFNDLFSIQYKRMNNCLDVATSISTTFTRYGGDTALNRVALVEFDFKQTGIHPAPIDLETNAVYFSFPSQDSWVNYEFRHGSKTDNSQIYFQYRGQPLVQAHVLLSRYLDRKKIDISNTVVAMTPETYNYNHSFSYLDGIQLFYPLPYFYQYCNDCVDDHPYRIYYSEKDTQETLEDKSRLVWPNNYKDLNGLSGEITDLFVNFDNVYSTTANSIYLVPTNPQVFQTDVNDVYIGTGEVLSVPPRELKNTQYAFGGQQYFKSRVNTEYGTFYIDALSKRPLLLTDNIEDLSLSGMRNFFQENGDIKFLDQFFKLTGIPFPFKSTSAPAGVGYISTYDPRYKRIIVHKRDFKILPTWEDRFYYFPLDTDIPLTSSNIPLKSIGYNGFNFYHVDASGNTELLHFENINFFENLSFTLSYSFISKHWVSFHSYLPQYMYNNSRTFLTTDEALDGSKNLFSHNGNTHQTYYGVKHPFIFDTVYKFNPLEQKIISSIVYTSKAYEKDFATGSFKVVPKTFNKFIAYNEDQSTGLQDLIVKDSPFLSSSAGIALVKETDNQWRLNNLRDNVKDTTLPIWDYTWAAKADTPYIYTDKVPYNFNIDLNKTLFQSARLKDNYVGLRFFLDVPEDFKLVTDATFGYYQNKNR